MSSKIRQFTLSFLGAVVRIVVLIIAIVVLYRLGAKAYDFGFRIFTEKAVDEENGRDVTVTISSDDSDGDIAKTLEEKGLIRDATLFRIQKLLSSNKGEIKPGSYTINTSMTAEQILGVLCKSEDGEEETETLSQPDALVEQTDSTITPLGNSSLEDLEEGDWEGTEETEEEVEGD